MTTGNGESHRRYHLLSIVFSKVLGVLSVPLVMTYPLTKRWTHWVSISPSLRIRCAQEYQPFSLSSIWAYLSTGVHCWGGLPYEGVVIGALYFPSTRPAFSGPSSMTPSTPVRHDHRS